MKCPKCQKEMCYKSFVVKNNYPESDHKWVCECGNVHYTPKIRVIDNNQTNTASNKIEIIPTPIVFICQICGGSQPCRYFDKIIFPVCNKCKSALKELIEQKNLPNKQ